MTEPKKIASSLKNLLDSKLVLDILDRTSDIVPAADLVKSFWDYDLFTRKPSPAYNEYGIFHGTDLDLACFLYSLSGRGAVINIPWYKAATQKKKRKDQELSSSRNRHGELLSVVGNQTFFKFNVKIIDQNVIGADRVGDPRLFTMTDYDGNWYPGWEKIEFVPTLNENKFITENKLWSGHRIVSKLMSERITEEAKFLNREIKEMNLEGIKFAVGEGIQSHDYEPPGETKSVTFNAFEAKIHVPELGLKGEFVKPEHNQKTLLEIYEKRKGLNRIKEGLTFMTRATEYAHHIVPDRMPAWIQNAKWEDDFVEPGKRIKWTRLKLFQPGVGKHAVSILKRVYPKAAQVDIDY